MLATTVNTEPTSDDRSDGRVARPGWRTWAARAAFAGATAVNLAVVFAPQPDVPGQGVPGLDKVVHVAVFAAVACTGLHAGARARWLVPVLLAHAVTSEVIQARLLPGRSGDPWDGVADAAGVALGYALFRWTARHRWAPRHPRPARHGRARRR